MCRSVFNFYRGSGYWSTTPNPHLVGDNSVLERVDFRSRRLEVCRGAAWVYEAEALQPIPCRLHLQHSIAFRWFREKAFNRWGRGGETNGKEPTQSGPQRVWEKGHDMSVFFEPHGLNWRQVRRVLLRGTR